MLPPAQNPFSPERPTQSKTPLLSRIRTWLGISKAFTNCVPLPPNVAQRPSNHSRYLEDFEELEEIGSGSFSTVYKCRNRIGTCIPSFSSMLTAVLLDGWLYAVKQAKRKFQSSGDREKTLKEV